MNIELLNTNETVIHKKIIEYDLWVTNSKGEERNLIIKSINYADDDEFNEGQEFYWYENGRDIDFDKEELKDWLGVEDLDQFYRELNKYNL